MNMQQAVEAPTITSTSFHDSVYPHPIAGTLLLPLSDQVAEAGFVGHGSTLPLLLHVWSAQCWITRPADAASGNNPAPTAAISAAPYAASWR